MLIISALLFSGISYNTQLGEPNKIGLWGGFHR